jgi:hypothetical protein
MPIITQYPGQNVLGQYNNASITSTSPAPYFYQPVALQNQHAGMQAVHPMNVNHQTQAHGQASQSLALHAPGQNVQMRVEDSHFMGSGVGQDRTSQVCTSNNFQIGGRFMFR